MSKCSFCGKNIKEGTGKIFVHTSGRISSFCKAKCEKNLLKLKRKPRYFKWTSFYKKEKIEQNE